MREQEQGHVLGILCLDFQAEVQEMLFCAWWEGTTEGWFWHESCSRVWGCMSCGVLVLCFGGQVNS